MLDNITVQNFRGIKQLEVDDFSRVNVFVGRNATGKTSILEAISIAANPGSSRWLLTLANWREMEAPTAEQDDALRSYFYNLDISISPEIKFHAGHSGHTLSISVDTDDKRFTEYLDDRSAESANAPIASNSIREVRLTYDGGKKSTLRLEDNRIQGSDASIAPKLGGFYIHARRATSANETARLLTKLYEKKSEGQLLEVIKNIDSRVSRLSPAVRKNGGTVLVDVGLSHMIPMNALGDGFCRTLLMCTGLLSSNTKVLIVDEIDSGLHYSVMKSVWSALGSLGDKQVFCATHSDEMLMNTLGAFKNDPDALRIFRVAEKDDGTMSVTKLDYRAYYKAAGRGEEIR